MKKIIPAILCAALLAGCAEKKNFDVTLNVPEDFKDQTVVLLNSANGDTIALTSASDTIVSIKGEIEKPTFATAICNSIPLAQFVLEPGNINVIDGEATGTHSNDQYAQLNDSLYNGTSDQTELVLNFMRQNPANPYSVALLTMLPHAVDAELVDTIMALHPDFSTNPTLQQIQKAVKTRQNTSKGGNYIDFTLTDAAGKEVSLADYVTKAKLTVVDFWASWCGPCRAEIPNLISLYNEYKSKGLEVVGVDVWERDEAAGPKAVEDMKIPYPIMYGGDENITNIYGIMGIPTIIVIDQEGNILARDIRGEELADFIKSTL